MILRELRKRPFAPEVRAAVAHMAEEHLVFILPQKGEGGAHAA